MITSADIIGAAPPGSTVTIQLDQAGNPLAWYIRMPDPAARALAHLPQRAYWLNGKSVTNITLPPEGVPEGSGEQLGSTGAYAAETTVHHIGDSAVAYFSASEAPAANPGGRPSEGAQMLSRSERHS